MSVLKCFIPGYSLLIEALGIVWNIFNSVIRTLDLKGIF